MKTVDLLTASARRLGRAAPVGLAAIATAVAVSSPAAGAALGSVRATLTTANLVGANCRVSVGGVVSMSHSEALALVGSGHRIVVRVWGEDPLDDDLLLGPYYLPVFLPGYAGSLAATPEGLKFHVHQAVSRKKLDEDDAVPLERDEVYAGIRLVSSDGKTIRSGETNRIAGPFGTGRYDTGCV